MDLVTNPEISHAIQQAVAPVFLMTGIGSVLSVLTSRLSRVVDRFRALENDKGRTEKLNQEMRVLSRRASWIHWAITLCTTSALCVCISIAALFISAETALDLSRTVSFLFIAAMLALVSGLICFLREISLSTGVIELPLE